MQSRVFKKFFCLLFSLLFVFGILVPQTSQRAYAATVTKQTVKSSVLQKGQQFTLVNMPYNGEASIIRKYKDEELSVSNLQNFDYTPDGKYILTISECRTGNKKHGLLTRCALPDKTGKNAKAECLEALVLENFGHSDVLAVTQDNLSKQVYNIWVSCKPDTDGYGRQIARLTYKVSKSGTGKITKTVYIKGFEKTNVSKGKAGYYPDKVKPEWVQCAIDTDSNQIVFRLKLPSGYGSFYLSYNFKKINSALNSTENKKSFNIASEPKWQKARVSCDLTPLCSFQSFDVKGKTLYLAGGNFGLGAQIYVISYKTYKDGNVKEQTVKKKSQLAKIITLDTVIKVDDAYYDKNYLEIEGIKVIKSGKKTYCHVNFICDGPSLRDTIGIYRFTV